MNKKIKKILLVTLLTIIPFISYANISIEEFDKYSTKIENEYFDLQNNYKTMFPLKTHTRIDI